MIFLVSAKLRQLMNFVAIYPLVAEVTTYKKRWDITGCLMDLVGEMKLLPEYGILLGRTILKISEVVPYLLQSIVEEYYLYND